ncbi:MAG: TraR/DksA C4-type zinc finger protein [Candidatus Nanopelagicales bacterium]
MAKATAKKAPAKKAPAKKTPAKKAPVKKVAKKAPVKKAPAKKVAKKAPAKKAPVKKAVKKAPVKKVAKKATAKKAVKKAPAKKAPVKKAPAKKVAKKAPVKKVAKKAPVKKAPVKKAPAKKPVKKTAVKLPAKRKIMPVREDESPWTAKEMRQVRGQLNEELERLQAELVTAEEGLADLIRDSGDGAGDDQADAGSKTFEREHEMSLANNARSMVEQVEHALQRIDQRTYGICESCGNPIGKFRLQAFPRATLCMACKQAEERFL